MKRFIRNLLAFAALLLLLCAAILGFDVFVMGNQYTNAYTGAMVDKVARMRSIEEPKILLVGNSNVSFGMDSAKIEEALGMPVVNLGLHGDLGNRFHENMAKLGIGRGDIVVVCHTEYDETDIKDPVLLCTTLEKHWDLWPMLTGEDVKTLVRGYPRYLLNTAKNWAFRRDIPLPDNAYTRSAMNEYGDVALRPEQEKIQVDFSANALTVPGIGEACIEQMNGFHAYVREQGAVMLVSFYPVAMGEYSPEEEAYRQFQGELEAQLDCRIISDITDYFIPYACFYDTVYHLNDRGVSIRTEQLIRDLRAWMEETAYCPED